MVPRGTELRLWIGGKDYKITNFRQWFELLMQCRSNLSLKTEPHAIVEADSLAAQGDGGDH